MRLLCVFLGLFSVAAQSSWTLQNDQSSLHFVSTKNSVISEIHQFTSLSGSIDDAGKVEVIVALDSVNTGIDIRDQRMQKMLFNVSEMPTATLRAAVDPALLNLTVGQTKIVGLTGSLTLNQKLHDLPMKLRITRLETGNLIATTMAPIMLDASQFALSVGIGKLQQIAGLADISLVVPVTFSVQFKAQ